MRPHAVSPRFLLTLFLHAVALSAAMAQTQGSVVAVLPGSTRAAALGGTGVALVGDAGSLFANPAGIATVRRLALEGSLERYVADVNYTAAAVAGRAGPFNWGFGVQALDYGSEAEIVPDPATGGRRGIATGNTFHPVDAIGLATLVYRFRLLALGVSGKYARQDFGAAAADAWAADVGLAVALFDIAAIGFAVQNLGGALDGGDELPQRTRLGMTLNYTDPQGTLRLLTTLEGQWEAERAAALALGVEGGVVTGGVGLVGRLGYVTPGALTDASPWTVGAGLVLGGVAVDYAFRSWQTLGAGTHRLGVRWRP